MPALVNKSVGSFPGTNGLDATMVCPWLSKYLRNLSLNSALLVIKIIQVSGMAGRESE
jgi:hypothetical protein